MTVTTFKRTRAIRAVKARIASTLTRNDHLHVDGEVLRLQGLVAAYHRNLRQVKLNYQRTVIQKALRRTQAQLRLARRNSRYQGAA